MLSLECANVMRREEAVAGVRGTRVLLARRSGSPLVLALLGVVGLLLLIGAPNSYAEDATAPPAVAQGTPVSADMTMILTEVSGLNLMTDTFHATFYLSLACDRPCEVSEWDVLNAQSLTREIIAEEDGATWWVVSGTFTFDPQLRLFPFDTQMLPIQIEHRLLDSSELLFVPNVDASEVAPEVTIAGWDKEAFEFTSTTTVYRALGADYSRATFTQPVSRSTLASITKYYVPLVIFILVGASTLLLARFDVQIGTAAAALVGLTVFYLATSGGVGAVGYLTVWDLSLIIGYLVLGLVLMCGVIGTRRTDAGVYETPEGEAAGRRLRRAFLAAVTLVVMLGGAGILLTAVLT